jgi:hypothetical protein
VGVFDDIRGAAGGAFNALGSWVVGSNDDVSPDQMNDALAKAGMGLPEATEEKPRALFHDPYSVMDWGGWRQRPSSLTYETLRQMTTSNTVIAAILNLRIHQVGAFCRPQQGKYDRGYRIILRDRRDKNKGMTPAEQTEANEIERMLETTGVMLPNERYSDRDNFRAFSKKSVRDVLTYDQWCFEKIRDQRGRVSRFIALPSETIRPAVSDIEHMDPAELRNRVSHVQVYENTVIAEFASDDLAWCVMNPRSDLRTNGFGFSFTEQIVRLVTSWLFGFEYNTKFFTQGSAIKGLLNIKGAIPDRQMRAFRRMWYAQLASVQNAWKTPILNSDDIQWVSMHSANREMEYAAWMDWLTKLICAVFGIDPIEINFIFGGGGTGGGSAMFDRRPNEAEVTESKDKGLRPLLTHMEDHINQHIVWDMNPDFEFAWSGFDAAAEAVEREARMTEVTKVKTVNQIRAEMDEAPLPGKLGDIILDPTFFQWMMAQEAAAEEAQGMGPEGAPPGEGGPPPTGGEPPMGAEPTAVPAAADDDDDEEDFLHGMTESEDDDDDLLAASYAVVEQAEDLLRKSNWYIGDEHGG